MIFIYNHHNNRKLKIAYEKIILNLDQKKNEKQNAKVFSMGKCKEIENEDKIVKQLEILEQKQFYIEQNMSAAKMAVLLKITPRNLSYILKKYRDEDFYNYLNNMRIDYFTLVICNNPKYRRYKIAVLSSMIGYSSHSQFTISFKNRTGITPSQYISLLQKASDE